MDITLEIKKTIHSFRANKAPNNDDFLNEKKW